MYILLTLLIIIIISILLLIISPKYIYNNDLEILPTMSIIIFSMIFVGFLLGIWLGRNSDYDFIQTYKADKYTFQVERSNELSPLERVSMEKSIEEDNQRISKLKYWNNTQWDWWTVDEVTKLEFLK